MCTTPSPSTPVAAICRLRTSGPESISSVSVDVGAGRSIPNGGVSSRCMISGSGVSEKSSRHQAAAACRSGSMPRATGGRLNEPASSRGSVRTTGVVSGGIWSIAVRTSSGGVTLMRQSAPTCACAASSWLRRTIAR